jgi:hypothetical protein
MVRTLRIADIVVIVVGASLIVLAITEGFVKRLATTTKDMRLLLFVGAQRATILVYDVDIPFNDDGTFRVTTYLGWARVTGIGHN